MTPDVPDLATTEPDAVVDGRRVFFVWARPTLTPVRTEADGQVTACVDHPSIPYGALIEHPSPNTGGLCLAWLPWVDTDPDLVHWKLLSLKPLSIAEAFTCSRCGALGGIRDGRWLIGLA